MKRPLQSPPPTALGLIGRQVSWLPVGVPEHLAVPLVGSETPFSNTGFIGLTESTALIDFVSVTVPLSSFSQFSTSAMGAAPKNAEAVACHAATTPGLAQFFFDKVFQGTAIEARAFERKGLFGYTHSAALHVAGVEGSVGLMGVGGNGNTVYISLSGAGCAWVNQWRLVARQLEYLQAAITRVDLAFDDFHGEYFDLPWICDLARSGYFDAANGCKVRRSKIDDLGSLKGSSLYIGKKGTKEFNLYEKGKQLQSSNSAWIRGEGRIWAKNREIPPDVLTRPMAYMRGEFPDFAAFMPFRGSASKAVSTKAKAEATIEAAEQWVLRCAGKTLNFLRRAAEVQGREETEVLVNLSRVGTPNRFAGIPEEVAFRRTIPIYHKGVPA